jgi:hypothetical protein
VGLYLMTGMDNSSCWYNSILTAAKLTYANQYDPNTGLAGFNPTTENVFINWHDYFLYNFLLWAGNLSGNDTLMNAGKRTINRLWIGNESLYNETTQMRSGVGYFNSSTESFRTGVGTGSWAVEGLITAYKLTNNKSYLYEANRTIRAFFNSSLYNTSRKGLWTTGLVGYDTLMGNWFKLWDYRDVTNDWSWYQEEKDIFELANYKPNVILSHEQYGVYGAEMRRRTLEQDRPWIPRRPAASSVTRNTGDYTQNSYMNAEGWKPVARVLYYIGEMQPFYYHIVNYTQRKANLTTRESFYWIRKEFNFDHIIYNESWNYAKVYNSTGDEFRPYGRINVSITSDSDVFTKIITSSLTDIINVTPAVFTVQSCDIESIQYTSDTGTYTKSYTTDEYDCDGSTLQLTLNLTGVEPATGSNELNISYNQHRKLYVNTNGRLNINAGSRLNIY